MPLLILLSTALFLLLLLLLYVVVRKKRGVILIEDDGPLDLAREEEREAEGGIAGLESRWLESVDLATRAGYLRAKGEASLRSHRRTYCGRARASAAASSR